MTKSKTMKFLISTILLLAFSVTTFAQNLVFSTPSHLEEVTYTAEFRNYDIKFKTPQPQETVYKWDRVSLTLPETWNFSLCDHMGCYAGVPLTGTMNTITLEQSQNGFDGFLKGLSTTMILLEMVGLFICLRGKQC
jgi:hypothetical protein